ncbi:MAG TPA: hypothetical protein DEB17_04290 [Chlorobaculum sp.]|uniref:Uncharacterized protein n=1 Tax=Chlorobaculum tepidum (strain ATCC 49652 / DSM 12025 / NBRC 103806 / TLS) TaxID=194439 RepID=Q8KAG1_CHLTE|nr:hypothetical protein CT2201 [Chlorobaculum tepidum TLS]HBU23204.1 hypothetical protein [Chlorobaculum sp.]
MVYQARPDAGKPDRTEIHKHIRTYFFLLPTK